MSGAPASSPEVRVAGGKAFIICNAELAGKPPLLGYRKDAKDLKAALKGLGLDVDLLHDLTASETESTLAAASKLDYDDYDMMLVVICSYSADGGARTDGGRFSRLWGTDGKLIDLDAVAHIPFARNFSLASKPKIFLIQVCWIF